MALYWNWNKCVGKCISKQGEMILYQGNAFLIAIYEWEKDEEQLWNMAWFFVDEAHCKRCLGLEKGSEKMDFLEGMEFHLDSKNKNCKKFVQLLAKAEVKCTIKLI